MKKILAVLVVVAMALTMTATAFGADWLYYGFEKKQNSAMWAEHWYQDCTLRHVNPELSTEQVKSGQRSLKVSAPAGEDEYILFGLLCEPANFKKVTTDMVFDCDMYIPEDGNVYRIVFYLCDETWQYYTFGSYVVEEWDTWISLSDVFEYLYFQDYVDNGGSLPCYFIIECDAEDSTQDSYFYFDNFYIGLPEDHKTALAEAQNNGTQGTNPTATPEATEVPADNNKTDYNEMTLWFVVGGVVAVVFVVAVGVVFIAKKKK